MSALRPPRRRLFLWPWAAVALGLLGAKWYCFADPPYWDSFCYVDQSRFLALHGLDLRAYRELVFLRPPVYTGLLALVMRLGGTSLLTRHVASCMLGFAVLPATFVLSRRLGGTRRAAWIAVLLCAAAPIFVAQSGLVQSDLLATALCTLTWAALLGRRTSWFVLLAILAVLTKEACYFLCAPAFLLLYRRALDAGPPPSRRLFGIGLSASALLRSWPALVPGLTLFGWLLCHRLLLGVAIPAINSGSLALGYLPDALLHDLIEDGRAALAILTAGTVLRRLRRPAPAAPDDIPIYVTAGTVLALPFFFPAPLPRYMLLTLPMLCALAALHLDALLPQRSLLLGTAAVALQVLCWHGGSWHTTGGHHMDANLDYRAVLATELAAVRELARERPRSVVATFPLVSLLRAPPEDGVLPAPVSGESRTDLPLSDLCRHDFLVDATQNIPMDEALDKLRSAGALLPWRSYGRRDAEVRVYRIACRTGPR